jgi:ACS family glucarate transporter-like MFS transporter
MATEASAGAKIGTIRWLMVLLAFASAAVAYLDRANISIAAGSIKSDFKLNNYQLGFVFSAFTFGYALTQPLAGRLADRYGARKIVAIGIFCWCLLTFATTIVPARFGAAFMTLLLVRLALGAGESMLFPASNKLVSNWIPTQERGLANGIIFAGVGIGAGIAPPLITSIMLLYNWRAAFWLSALIGLICLIVWLAIVRETPATHPWVRAAELAHIKAGLTSKESRRAGAEEALGWKAILSDRNVQLLTFSYFCFGYVAYIFFTWFFTYLSTVRGLDLKSSGLYGTLPFIAMAICSPAGGWLADLLTARLGKRAGRCYFAAFGMGLASLFVALATQAADARVAVMILAGGSGALYLAQSAFWSLSADMGRGSAGSLSGLMNMWGQLGGTLVASVTPLLADYLGWSGSFIFTAAVALLGALAWLPIDPTRSVSAKSRS